MTNQVAAKFVKHLILPNKNKNSCQDYEYIQKIAPIKAKYNEKKKLRK